VEITSALRLWFNDEGDFSLEDRDVFATIGNVDVLKRLRDALNYMYPEK